MPRKPSRWSLVVAASAFFLSLGIWKNIRLSFSVVNIGQRHSINDGPNLVDEGATSAQKRRKSKSNHNAFPKWNDIRGIQWEAIESYIRYADANLMSGKDLLECPNGGCPLDMPNVLYIFGARDRNRNTNNHISGTMDLANVAPNPKTWVESRRRKKIGPGFAKRYPIMEELMDRSLTYFLSMDRDAATTQYPRLVQRIRPNVDRNNHTFLLLGIPLLANFGDNRQCHFQNLKYTRNDANKSTVWHNVPVFTLAVPADCQFAFPIPHPAALDTAKVYGDRWESILDRRHRSYPQWNKIRRAVWRGSPTGWPMNQEMADSINQVIQENQTVWRGSPRGLTMRQQMVHTANHMPKNNQTLMLQVQRLLSVINATNTSTAFNNATLFFDVGFGKPFHKIVPTYKGPLIPRQSKIEFEDFAQYRVVLDADGSSWSERFGPLLCLNSVVAKIEPAFVDWLWPHVQANTHFMSIQKDSSNLWSVVLPFLDDDPTYHRGPNITSQAQEWCVAHMTYPRMIRDFLESLERYVEYLDRGDGEWPIKWKGLFLIDMPPTHHNWQAIPVKTASEYFPLWRED